MIDIKNLLFKYPTNGGSNLFGLNIKNINIPEGDFMLVLGPNGSGKSTLLKLVSGILLPDNGSITLAGKDIHSLSENERAKKLAYVPQLNFSLQPYSVYDTIMMGRFPYLGFWGIESDNDKKVVEEAIKTTGLNKLRNKRVDEISGGELQRTLIARALAQEPEILLMDEPNANLDIEHQISVFNLFRELNEDKGITIVIISHDLNLSVNYGKSCIMLKEGKLMASGNIREIITDENIKSVFNVETSITENEKRINVQLLI